MSEEMDESQQDVKLSLKPIRKVNRGQELYVNLNAFQDDMDERTIELEWGKSTGATILLESNFKYDIVERIDKANQELDDILLSSSCSNSSSSSNTTTVSKKKGVHFSQTVHTAHYLSPIEGEYDDHEDMETGGYWSAEEISATPDDEMDHLEECTAATTNLNREMLITPCRTPETPENWYDSEDGSSVDLSALTDSVDRLDLSPLNTDSPLDSLRPCTPSLRSPQSLMSSAEPSPGGNGKANKKIRDARKLSPATRKWSHPPNENQIQCNKSKKQLNKWNRTNIKINCWNLAESNLNTNGSEDRFKTGNQDVKGENKVQRRICLSRQDQTKLPKYNGLRSEYGLSQQQLIERKRVKAEKNRLRQQRRIDKQREAHEKRKANQLVFNNWLDKKKQQIQIKNKQFNKWNPNSATPCSPQQRAFSAHVIGRRKVLSAQGDSSKLGLLKRIMSASVHSAKEQMTYSIYLGLPVPHATQTFNNLN